MTWLMGLLGHRASEPPRARPWGPPEPPSPTHFVRTRYTGFTFLSTVKSTKFSRPGYPGVLNLVPLGTKFSTAQIRKNSRAGYILYEERLRGTAQKGCFLREKRLSNAQERGICEANAGHAPRAMMC